MTQTVKFGKIRAGNDPDRSNTTDGITYRNNMPGHNRPYCKGIRVTRGAWRRRVTL